MSRQGFLRAWRALPLIVLVTLTPGLLARGQVVELDPGGDLARRHHAETLRAERTARFLQAYEAASPERRAACDAAVRAVLPYGRPAGMRPLLEELALFTRVLDGEAFEVVRDDVLARFVDALDLRVVPGAFQARDGDAGRGQPLTVHVIRAYPVPISGEVQVTLFWIAPDGRELSARSEPFSAAVFKPPGASMYVRAPASRPGTWQLVPQVSRGARSVRGVPVDVRCVEVGAPLEAALFERGLRSIELDAALGVRLWQDGAFDASFEPWVLEGGDEGATVLFLTPSEESPKALFTGEAGARWDAFAREGGHRLVSLRSRVAPGLAQGLEVLRRREPERQLFLVASGDAVRSLVGEAIHGALMIDGLVLVAEKVAFPRALAEVPAALLVAHDLPPELAAQEQVRWIQLAAPLALLVEAELPGMLEDWWGEGAAQGR